MSAFTLDKKPDGIAILTFDLPGASTRSGPTLWSPLQRPWPSLRDTRQLLPLSKKNSQPPEIPRHARVIPTAKPLVVFNCPA